MKTIILSQTYPDNLNYRQQVRELAQQLKISIQDDPQITIDVNSACLSRSAMDEFYKSFMDPKSELSEHITIINSDKDFNLKLKAVRRSQGVKKHLRTFTKEQIITVKTPNDLKRFVHFSLNM